MSRPAETLPGTVSDEQSTAARQCWSCAAKLGPGDLFCPACGRVQPLPGEVDYFQVFALARKLELDTAALERDYYRLSRRLHPDLYVRAGQQEQEWSVANSSLLNDAYRTLKDPVRRTEYLLRLEGLPTGEQGGAKKEDRVPADLLEEVFELNLQLDEMRNNRQVGEDDPQLQEDLRAAKSHFDAQFKATDASLEKLWEKWDAAIDRGGLSERQAAKEEIASLLDRRRYIRNLVDSVNEALEL